MMLRLPRRNPFRGEVPGPEPAPEAEAEAAPASTEGRGREMEKKDKDKDKDGSRKFWRSKSMEPADRKRGKSKVGLKDGQCGRILGFLRPLCSGQAPTLATP